MKAKRFIKLFSLLAAVLLLFITLALPIFAQDSASTATHPNDQLLGWLVLLVYLLAIPFYFIFAIIGSIVAVIAIIVSLIAEIVIFFANLFGITLSFALFLLL